MDKKYLLRKISRIMVSLPVSAAVMVPLPISAAVMVPPPN